MPPKKEKEKLETIREQISRTLDFLENEFKKINTKYPFLKLTVQKGFNNNFEKEIKILYNKNNNTFKNTDIKLLNEEIKEEIKTLLTKNKDSAFNPLLTDRPPFLPIFFFTEENNEVDTENTHIHTLTYKLTENVINLIEEEAKENKENKEKSEKEQKEKNKKEIFKEKREMKEKERKEKSEKEEQQKKKIADDLKKKNEQRRKIDDLFGLPLNKFQKQFFDILNFEKEDAINEMIFVPSKNFKNIKYYFSVENEDSLPSSGDVNVTILNALGKVKYYNDGEIIKTDDLHPPLQTFLYETNAKPFFSKKLDDKFKETPTLEEIKKETQTVEEIKKEKSTIETPSVFQTDIGTSSIMPDDSASQIHIHFNAEPKGTAGPSFASSSNAVFNALIDEKKISDISSRMTSVSATTGITTTSDETHEKLESKDIKQIVHEILDDKSKIKNLTQSDLINLLKKQENKGIIPILKDFTARRITTNSNVETMRDAVVKIRELSRLEESIDQDFQGKNLTVSKKKPVEEKFKRRSSKSVKTIKKPMVVDQFKRRALIK